MNGKLETFLIWLVFIAAIAGIMLLLGQCGPTITELLQ
jgi:hypothetical protein